jgi:hypothetical protein
LADNGTNKIQEGMFRPGRATVKMSAITKQAESILTLQAKLFHPRFVPEKPFWH